MKYYEKEIEEIAAEMDRQGCTNSVGRTLETVFTFGISCAIRTSYKNKLRRMKAS
jgi:hypothetical protein